MKEDVNKINVMQVSNQLSIGGTEKALQILTEHINKDIFNVYVCGVFSGGVREKILREKGFETYVINGDPIKFFQLLKKKNIHIVHVHRSGKSEGFIIQVAKKAGVPIIVETNVFGLYDNSEAGKMIDIHLLISKTTALKYIQNAKISLNEFLNKGTVLYYPVDWQKFIINRPSETQIYQFKSELGIDKNTPLICRVGRNDLGKWNEFLVDVMKHLTKKIPEIKILIVGGIPEPIKRKIQKLRLEEKFIDIGPILQEEKLILIYYSIDILTHSSRIGESFGYTIAEAMAAGKPVVVNSTPWADNAQIELVDNGKTGLIANTPRTYAEAITYLIEHKKEAKRMGLAGQEKVKKEYDARKITSCLEKIYLNLLLKKNVTKIDKIADLINNYEKSQYCLTDNDILNYITEYNSRLNNYFGKLSLIEYIKFNLKYLKEKTKNILLVNTIL